jgi:rfaE bifunctional protein kinase chain/domain
MARPETPPHDRFLAELRSRHGCDRVVDYLDRIRDLKILVVGETIIDEYVYCDAIGKSSKEPILVIKIASSERFAGGILAVANHVANFSDRVGLISFLGSSNGHEDFVHDRLSDTVDARFLMRSDSPTIVKRRYIERYFFQKLFEVYEINDDRLPKADNLKLCELLLEQLPGYDVVIVVDFGHGILSAEAIELLCAKARFLAVNAQSNAGNLGYHSISKYPRADHVSMAENEIRLEARDRRGDLREIVLELVNRMGYGRVVVTRGSHGCLCYSQDEGFVEVPPVAEKVVDRIGAGDAFLSLTAPCAALGAPLEVLGFIGNAVGAEAVATVGNREAVAKEALRRRIEGLLT